MMKSRLNLFFLGILTFMCLIPGMVVAQTMTVSGSVTDEDGGPLIAVTVSVQGTNQVVLTDAEGVYRLTGVNTGASIEFKYVGYATQVLTVNSTVMDVVMAIDSQELERVVVVGYGAQRKVTLTGAVANVGSKELLKSPAGSLGNALAGRLPGVQSVQYSGMPGADDPAILIRGVGSLNNSYPLVMVDGVERSFTQLDPNEVADISILKDASATAVFGVRGANGVILVTTKRGQEGKTSVSFTAQGGVQQITNFLEPANSYEYATAFNRAQKTDNPDLTDDKLKYSAEAIQHFRDRDMLMVYPDTNWFEYLMKNSAWQQQYNINVSGGSEFAKYFVSVGTFSQDGLFRTFNQSPEATFKYRRYNYRVNLDLNLSKYSTLNVGIGGRLSVRNSIGGGEGGEDGGQQGIFANEGLLNTGLPMSGYGLDDQGRRIVSDPNLVGEHGGDALGRIYQLGYTTRSLNVLNLDLQYQLKMDYVTPGLSFKVKGSYNSDYTAIKDREADAGANKSWMATIRDGEQVLIPRGDSWVVTPSESLEGGRNWYMEGSLNYERSFGKHNVTGLLLYNQSKTYYPWDSDGPAYRSIPKGYVGMVGRVTYNYDTRYLLDVNMGYNGSENFAPGKRYGRFPSASVGWIASSESFWEHIEPVVQYMKLRASIGRVGNDATQDKRFLYLPGTYSFFGGGNGGGFAPDRTTIFGTGNGLWMQGAKEVSQGNPNVTWETATKQNFGVDLAFLRSRLSLSVDVFFEDRRDILVSNATTVAGVTALQASFVNFGRVSNRGYEIVTRWEDKLGDFRYWISPTVTYAKNNIEFMAEVPQDEDYLYRTGHPVGQPFGYEFFEFYNPGVTEERYKAQYGVEMPNQIANIKAGDSIYVDLNGDGMVDAKDQHAIGYTDVPEYTGSLNLGLSYKGFDFSMLWIGATNTNRRLGAFYNPAFGTGNISMLNKWVYDNSWTAETAATATLPRISFTNRDHNARLSKVWLVDTSYARLKNVEIGYTFKIKQIPQVQSIRVYATGYNLLTFSKFKGNDPEARQGEWGVFIKYPLTRVYNFGVNVNF
jgi:TonB-linked SusC/RagA family outer membrane protein